MNDVIRALEAGVGFQLIKKLITTFNDIFVFEEKNDIDVPAKTLKYLY